MRNENVQRVIITNMFITLDTFRIGLHIMESTKGEGRHKQNQREKKPPRLMTDHSKIIMWEDTEHANKKSVCQCQQ